MENIKVFLRSCDWVINGESGELGFTTTYDKYLSFKDEYGYDFSEAWDNLSDDDQWQLMQECCGLHD